MHEHHHIHDDVVGWIPVFIVCFVFLFYLSGIFFLRTRAGEWSSFKTVFFSIGCALVAIAVSPEMMAWGHANIRGHMVQHLLIAMIAPIFLVMGAPMTLLLKTLDTKMARRITRLLRSSFFSILSHPFVALILNLGGMFALYLTPLYTISLSDPIVHYLVHIHFLAAGYLFTWSIIGADPVPQRPRFTVRVVILSFSIALHAFLTKWMYAHLLPQNTGDTSDDIREAAKLMYYGGDASELLLLVILFAMRYSKVRQEFKPGVRLEGMSGVA